MVSNPVVGKWIVIGWERWRGVMAPKRRTGGAANLDGRMEISFVMLADPNPSLINHNHVNNPPLVIINLSR